MENAINELPLVIFTALAAISAGYFVVFAINALGGWVSIEKGTAVADKLKTLLFVPLALGVVGFIASFTHLASPLRAFGAFTSLGTSPLSNEILFGAIFIIVAALFCILFALGKLNGSALKACSVVLGLLGLLFLQFIGMAYAIDTVPSWNNPWVILQVWGAGLLGGTVLLTALFAQAGSLKEVKAGSAKNLLIVLTVVGLLLLAIGIFAQVAITGGLSNSLVAGSELVSEVMGLVVGAVILAILAAVLVVVLLAKEGSAAIAWLAVIVALIAIFLARLVFYALEISVGL